MNESTGAYRQAIDGWLAERPHERSVLGSYHQGRAIATLLDRRRVVGSGVGATIEEAVANALNDVMGRMYGDDPRHGAALPRVP